MRAVLVTFIAVAALATAPSAASAGPPSSETIWVGHQYVKGRRVVPFLGALRTRTDAFLIARVRRSAGRIELTQHTCRVSFAKVAGGYVTMKASAVRRMPRARIVFEGKGKLLYAKAWRVGWGREDIDGDGKPGMTVTIKAPLCGGDLQVGTRTVSIARGLLRGRSFVGQIAVRVKQSVFGASGRCLRVVAKGSSEQMVGFFAYRPAPAGTTCATLARGKWPVRAPQR